MTAYCATLSLPRVPAKVPSRSDLPTFVIVRCQHAGGCGEEIELANDLDQRRTTLAGEQPEGCPGGGAPSGIGGIGPALLLAPYDPYGPHLSPLFNVAKRSPAWPLAALP
jgi:hypothetical protein